MRHDLSSPPEDMVKNRNRHREPVISASVALRGETHVEVSDLTGGGLFVFI